MEQIIESIRRWQYVGALNGRKISAACADPPERLFRSR